MLVLTRKIEQKIMIGKDTIITVKAIRDGDVILNISHLNNSENIEFYRGKIVERNNYKLWAFSSHPSQARIGIEAPPNVSIYREEIFVKLNPNLNSVH